MELVDLSNYCVVCKYQDGWLVHPIDKMSGNWNCQFISTAELVRMGYLNETHTFTIDEPARSSVIVVPSIQFQQ